MKASRFEAWCTLLEGFAGARSLSAHASFGGQQGFFEHHSEIIGGPMRFGLYLPPQVEHHAVPLVVFLAGLTCTEETFAIKAGAQRVAAHLGLAILTPDTSPRHTRIAGQADAWDFGVGAGFYLDATRSPWSEAWRMESYLMRELIPQIAALSSSAQHRVSIMGHSMGGHGALTLALKYPDRFTYASAMAPICAPSHCPWGHKAFAGYLGDDRSSWLAHDATALMLARGGALFETPIRIDQGLADKFLVEQLLPDHFVKACAEVGQPLAYIEHPGYDHGYYFIASVIEAQLQAHC
jgi:S-formylglutathione hydrolase